MTTYFVSPTGNDNNNGSQTQPFLTIQKAANVVVAGDTVNVLPGTYTSVITSNANGTANARIVYQSTIPGGAILAPPGTHAYLWTNNGNYVDVVGFEVDGSGSNATVGLLNYASFCSYRQNYIHNITCPDSLQFGAGIFHATYTASDNDTVGNRVGFIGTTGNTNHALTHGIYHTNLRGHIQNNIAYQCTGFGINLYHGASNVLVINNLVFKCFTGGITVGGVAGEGSGSDANTTVANNIIRDITGFAIIELGVTGTGNQYLNNLILNYTGNPGINVRAGAIISGTLDGVDPQFLNYQTDGSGNYHLLPASPCIDAGISTNAPATDFDGVKRPYGAGYDIGPFEYHVGSIIAITRDNKIIATSRDNLATTKARA